MVEQSASSEPPPEPLPWQTSESSSESEEVGRDPGLETREDVEVTVQPDALLIRPDETPAEVALDPELESYESLDAVVEAQGPVAYAPKPEPAPEEAAMTEEAAEGQEFSGPVEELEASPGERNMPPVEQLVRQAIEDLLPEIIDRVKKSLKS
jgi:hypothetical protein